jgi:antitoxin CptB
MLDTARKRLLYQSLYRGCKETDILIGSYARSALGTMSEEGLALFEALLEESDADIYQWIIGAKPEPLPYQAWLLPDIRTFHRNKVL